MATVKIGQLLIKKKLITPEQLERALDAQRVYGGKLGTNLVELKFVSDVNLAATLSEQLKLPSASLKEFEAIPKAVIDLVPIGFIREHKVMPLALDQRLRVAISDPSDLGAIDQLGFITGKGIQTAIAPEIWIVAGHERYYNLPRDGRYLRVNDVGDDDMTITQDISTDASLDYEGKYAKIAAEVPIPIFLNHLIRATTKEQVFEQFLRFLGPFFPKIAVFVARKDHFAGWMLRGFPIHDAIFGEVTVPFSAQSVLNVAAQSKMPYSGPFTEEEGPDVVGAALLEIPQRKYVRIYPIHFHGKPIALAVAVPEDQHHKLLSNDLKSIQAMCEKVGFALELVTLKRQIMQTEEDPMTGGRHAG